MYTVLYWSPHIEDWVYLKDFEEEDYDKAHDYALKLRKDYTVRIARVVYEIEQKEI